MWTGLKTALVERDDFSCGTSSKSTKLIHGGVRYLYKAFLGLDYEQVCIGWEGRREEGEGLMEEGWKVFEMKERGGLDTYSSGSWGVSGVLLVVART